MAKCSSTLCCCIKSYGENYLRGQFHAGKGQVRFWILFNIRFSYFHTTKHRYEFVEEARNRGVWVQPVRHWFRFSICFDVSFPRRDVPHACCSASSCYCFSQSSCSPPGEIETMTGLKFWEEQENPLQVSYWQRIVWWKSICEQRESLHPDQFPSFDQLFLPLKRSQS